MTILKKIVDCHVRTSSQLLEGAQVPLSHIGGIWRNTKHQTHWRIYGRVSGVATLLSPDFLNPKSHFWPLLTCTPPFLGRMKDKSSHERLQPLSKISRSAHAARYYKGYRFWPAYYRALNSPIIMLTRSVLMLQYTIQRTSYPQSYQIPWSIIPLWLITKTNALCNHN